MISIALPCHTLAHFLAIDAVARSLGPATSIETHHLLLRAIESIAHFPTVGEILTWIARRDAQLSRLYEDIESAQLAASDQRAHRAMHSFWTTARQTELKEAACELLQRILAIPLDQYRTLATRDSPVEQVARVVQFSNAEDHSLREAWFDHLHQTDMNSWEQQHHLLLQLVREAKIDEIDRHHLIEAIIRDYEERPRNVAHAHVSYYEREARIVDALLSRLGIIVNADDAAHARQFLFVRDESKVILVDTFSQAEQLLREDPTNSIETRFEHELRAGAATSLLTILEDRENEETDDTYDRTCAYLLRGQLAEFTDANPFVREALFRFLVDELGFNPRQGASLVTDREVRWGGDGQPGRWYLYPTNARGYGIAIGITSNENPASPFIRVFFEDGIGELERAKTALINDCAPIYTRGQSATDRQRLRKSADPAIGAIANPFQAHRQLFVAARIEEHLRLRADLNGTG